MKATLTVLATVAALMLVGLLFIVSGAYNVAATESHTALGEWILHTVTERSIAAHAYKDSEIEASQDLLAGYQAFSSMCVMCHGGPDASRWEPANGLLPAAPDLREEGSEWSLAELTWITEHGIKMTGMPAFGPSHSRQEIVQITTFIDTLSMFSEEESKRFIEQIGSRPQLSDTTGQGESGRDHTHEHGGH
jgi:mono/diheme cytochrome c family protein